MKTIAGPQIRRLGEEISDLMLVLERGKRAGLTEVWRRDMFVHIAQIGLLTTDVSKSCERNFDSEPPQFIGPRKDIEHAIYFEMRRRNVARTAAIRNLESRKAKVTITWEDKIQNYRTVIRVSDSVVKEQLVPKWNKRKASRMIHLVNQKAPKVPWKKIAGGIAWEVEAILVDWATERYGLPERDVSVSDLSLYRKKFHEAK